MGVLLLDGGLASELERRGCDLSDALWSARMLAEDPGAIAGVHRAYLEAGADLVTSAGYQASVPGFERAGHGRGEAEGLVREAVRIAAGERDRFAAEHPECARPLVAASVGPYGAFLADGSEYRGRYGVSEREVERFHRERLELVGEELRAGRADLVLCETIPSGPEALLLARLLDELELAPAWISLCAGEPGKTAEGQPLDALAEELSRHLSVEAVGVNCVAPELVEPSLAALGRGTTLPLVAYPNRGETWDAERKRWNEDGDPAGLAGHADAWVAAGARVLGGCCRTGPEEIAALRAWRDEHVRGGIEPR